MLNSDQLCIEKILNHTRSSERKFREGNFQGAIEDRRAVRPLLNSKICDKEIIRRLIKVEGAQIPLTEKGLLSLNIDNLDKSSSEIDTKNLVISEGALSLEKTFVLS